VFALTSLGYVNFVRRSYILAFTWVTKTAARSSYHEIQQCHRCLNMNMLYTPISDRCFLYKSVRGIPENTVYDFIVASRKLPQNHLACFPL
jgi:hypothetical protein